MPTPNYTIRRLANRSAVRKGTKLTRGSSLAAVSGLREIEALASDNGGMAGKSYVVPGDSLIVLQRLIDWAFTYDTGSYANVAGVTENN